MRRLLGHAQNVQPAVLRQEYMVVVQADDRGEVRLDRDVDPSALQLPASEVLEPAFRALNREQATERSVRQRYSRRLVACDDEIPVNQDITIEAAGEP